jgi:hypothetical protein
MENDLETAVYRRVDDATALGLSEARVGVHCQDEYEVSPSPRRSGG